MSQLLDAKLSVSRPLGCGTEFGPSKFCHSSEAGDVHVSLYQALPPVGRSSGAAGCLRESLRSRSPKTSPASDRPNTSCILCPVPPHTGPCHNDPDWTKGWRTWSSVFFVKVHSDRLALTNGRCLISCRANVSGQWSEGHAQHWQPQAKQTHHNGKHRNYRAEKSCFFFFFTKCSKLLLNCKVQWQILNQ